jgi:hypothetical protein
VDVAVAGRTGKVVAVLTIVTRYPRDQRQISVNTMGEVVVGNPGVEPGSSCSQGKRVTVSLVPGGSGRNRTGSSTLARRDRYLSCHPRGRRALMTSETGRARRHEPHSSWVCPNQVKPSGKGQRNEV